MFLCLRSDLRYRKLLEKYFSARKHQRDSQKLAPIKALEGSDLLALSLTEVTEKAAPKLLEIHRPMLIYEPDVDDPLHTRNSVDNARSEEKRARVVEY